MKSGRDRENVIAGALVLVVLKKDQHSGKLTRGVVEDVFTRSRHHPHGIKVRLQDGRVGRVKEVIKS
ncbi:MAG TPA: YwbE family protein [Methanobacteriaceae archaeon]|nr:YwbE family protein [Methanobacteriaceae archaeon]